jgi:hypothetical protein
LVPLQSVVGQSCPSTITFHQSFACRVRLRPGLKPVSPTSRVDGVFDVVVNEYSPFVYPCGKLPKMNWIDCSLTRRHFRSISHTTFAQKFFNEVNAVFLCRSAISGDPAPRPTPGRPPARYEQETAYMNLGPDPTSGSQSGSDPPVRGGHCAAANPASGNREQSRAIRQSCETRQDRPPARMYRRYEQGTVACQHKFSDFLG